MIESILLSAARVLTFIGSQRLTNASGFYFERDGRLFLVTSRHVLIDTPSEHFPDRIEIEVHTDSANMTQSMGFSVPLYSGDTPVWKQGTDMAGDIDVAVIELDRTALPEPMAYTAFNPSHLSYEPGQIEVGDAVLVVGFPLGFHDSLHHLPVARHAVIASSFSLRFEGQGYFLTDGRTHRGTSGAPVVIRRRDAQPELGPLTWMLLGVHSARIDIDTRDLVLDEALGLNCAWFADILLTLTASS